MVDYWSRLKPELDARDMGIQQFADALGVSYQAVVKVRDGGAFGTKNNSKAAKLLGLNSDWLATGKGQKLTLSAPVDADIGVVAVTPFLPGFEPLSIPLLANSGSMGGGIDQLHEEVVIGRLTVSPQWAQRVVKPTSLENLRFIHGFGDSMEPTFSDGDVLLVDLGVRDPKIDGVYVLEANDRVYIKRVRERMDGAIEVSSDNPTVKTVDVLDGSNEVIVHGRVVWRWNGKKM